MNTRYLIGRAELLTYPIEAPKKKPGSKAHPYTFSDARQVLLPAIESANTVFQTLPAKTAQVEHMIELTDELYPTLRWFLFDGLQRYAVPVTIFGPQRAALYLGQMFLVLSSTEHVRTLTRQFDDLIRGAVVHPNEISHYLGELLRSTRRLRR